MTLPDPPTEVPADETPLARCPHCDRPFRTGHARDLHVGETHAEALSAAEREAYEHALGTVL
jgi:hypothetical protein